MRTLRIAFLVVMAVLCAALSGCQSPTTRTTTTRMGITGVQETVVTEVPWESSFDRAFSEAIPSVMNSDFHP